MNPYVENTVIGVLAGAVVVGIVIIRYAWKLLLGIGICLAGIFVLVHFIHWAWTF